MKKIFFTMLVSLLSTYSFASIIDKGTIAKHQVKKDDDYSVDISTHVNLYGKKVSDKTVIGSYKIAFTNTRKKGLEFGYSLEVCFKPDTATPDCHKIPTPDYQFLASGDSFILDEDVLFDENSLTKGQSYSVQIKASLAYTSPTEMSNPIYINTGAYSESQGVVTIS